LPVNHSRDGAESDNGCAGWVEGSFCILALEISGPRPLETMTRREPRTSLTVQDQAGPTNVTAVVKSQTNRARSVAAGVVSGAGWCQSVIKTPHSDESASNRSRQSLHPIAFGREVESWVSFPQGSGNGGCVLRVVPGTMHTRKKRRDEPVSMNVVGRWIQTPPAHFGEGELRSRAWCLGTGNLRVRAAIGWEKYHDNVNHRFFRNAQPLELRNGNGRNTARAGGSTAEPCRRAPPGQPGAKTSASFLHRERLECWPTPGRFHAEHPGPAPKDLGFSGSCARPCNLPTFKMLARRADVRPGAQMLCIDRADCGMLNPQSKRTR
jgi:hypothetical protein